MGSSKNNVTALRWSGYQGFYDDSTEALVIKAWRWGKGVSKISNIPLRHLWMTPVLYWKMYFGLFWIEICFEDSLLWQTNCSRGRVVCIMRARQEVNSTCVKVEKFSSFHFRCFVRQKYDRQCCSTNLFDCSIRLRNLCNYTTKFNSFLYVFNANLWSCYK